jgi:hypothetical protein
MAAPVFAQNLQRRATMVGGGSPDRGKCTIEVVVDGAAEVEIRGDNATLRNLKGQQPEWRRFECSGVMPNNPADFRFSGVDGRGNQQLVRDPRNGGVAVVQIQDSDNGREGYTFDITWGNSGFRSDDRRPDNRDGGFRDSRPRFTEDDALRSCQAAVRQEAAQRLNAREIDFRGLDANDNRGPRDSVQGAFDVRRGPGRADAYRFSCSVNFDTGRVFDARIEPIGRDRGGVDGRRISADRAIDSCRRAVEDRMARDGFGNVLLETVRVDDRPGRNDWVIGNVRGNSRRGRAAFSFSCSVNLANGDVRSVDLQPR